MRTDDVLMTVVAGALGAVLATFLVGASILLAIPAALGVGAVSLVTSRSRTR